MCFTKASHHNSVVMSIDNTTAVSYINKEGGTRSKRLYKLAVNIWNWCENRLIDLQAFHLPRRFNILADHQLRAV